MGAPKLSNAVRRHEEREHALLGAPTSWDWRSQGAVTAVKNQQSCGSCYAFAAAEVIESNRKIRYGNLMNMSTQQYVSCSSAYGNGACQGGWYFYCWDYDWYYLHDSEYDYPYVSGGGSVPSCKYTGGYYYVDYQYQVGTSEADIKNAVYLTPQAIAIQAGTSYFQSYKSGILTDQAACGQNLDHAVVTVGYGTSNGTNYWIVRNSWSSNWGESGYVRIKRRANPGTCGENMYTAYAEVSA